MSFDTATRNKLANVVTEARKLLKAEVIDQLRRLGFQDDGALLDLSRIAGLAERDLAAAEALRALLDHLIAAEHGSGGAARQAAYDRMAREIGFTTLNRLVALRMAEERGLIVESVGRGLASDGFAVYELTAKSALGTRHATYRAYLECLYDEIARDLPSLFDRTDPHSAIFPGANCLTAVLALINAPALAELWKEDETIGWVYQYYNDPAERKAMRESQAPRTSRELAVRNQFFTPRYVVEFLTDNTLGRTWYEMRRGETRLAEQCRYMVRRKRPVFLGPLEEAPKPWQPEDGHTDPDFAGEMWTRPNPELTETWDILSYGLTVGYGYADEILHVKKDRFTYFADIAERVRDQYEQTGKWQGTFEELRICLFMYQRGASKDDGFLDEGTVAAIQALYQAICRQWDLETEYIPYRTRKDPRDIKILDPAVGSGHFLLYAFDLLITIYEEAWFHEKSPISEATGNALSGDYPNKAALQRAMPALILEHNLHGIDIDPRACQIAGLALWLRAQRAFEDLDFKAEDRPAIRRGNIICAAPMPGERDHFTHFLADLNSPTLARLCEMMWDELALAGVAGSLLKPEEQLRLVIEAERGAYLRRPRGQQHTLTPEFDRAEQQLIDFSDVTDEGFWDIAESRILTELREYSETVADGNATVRRLFADDAARGFAFIDLCRNRYDNVLMNPPFGEMASASKNYLETRYPTSKYDISAMFVVRWLERLQDFGLFGAITNKTGFFLQTFDTWRSIISTAPNNLSMSADLGFGVLDAAVVETMSYTIRRRMQLLQDSTIFIRLTNETDKPAALRRILEDIQYTRPPNSVWFKKVSDFQQIPHRPMCYWAGKEFIDLFRIYRSFSPKFGHIYQGIATGDNFRFLRCRWEISAKSIASRYWITYAKGGPSTLWCSDYPLVVLWTRDGHEMKANAQQCYGAASRTIKNEKAFFQEGLTYTQVTVRGFFARALPGDCIFDMKGPLISVPDGNLFLALGIFCSLPIRALAKLITDCRQWHPTNLMRLPYPILHTDEAKKLQQAVQGLVEIRQAALNRSETSSLYCCQARDSLPTVDEVSLSYSVDDIVARGFGAQVSDFRELDRILQPELTEVEDDETEELGSLDPTIHSLSYAVGCLFGRWDIRYATKDKFSPELPDPFAPLPVSPPGMLQNSQGLPAESSEVSSNYPLCISWHGILVDDEGHTEDIERRLREALQVIWQDRADSIEHEASQLLGVRSLRAYFRRPTGFFAYHLGSYSKSRRQAPIYWPLSTQSGSYTLWLYYHRLTSDLLFTAVNQYVQPKIAGVERELADLEARLAESTGREATQLREESDSQRVFRDELVAFRDELLRIAALPYRPNLNDGVIINAAPFHKLFRLPKWAKDTRECWTKLERGDYDWAHLAYTIWPERVREKCRADRSLAIAHDLEDLYEGPPPKVVKARGKAAPTLALIDDGVEE